MLGSHFREKRGISLSQVSPEVGYPLDGASKKKNERVYGDRVKFSETTNINVMKRYS